MAMTLLLIASYSVFLLFTYLKFGVVPFKWYVLLLFVSPLLLKWLFSILKIDPTVMFVKKDSYLRVRLRRFLSGRSFWLYLPSFVAMEYMRHLQRERNPRLLSGPVSSGDSNLFGEF